MLLLIVPVLPADGLFSASAWPKPPGSMTPRRMSLTVSAVFSCITWSQSFLYFLNTLPSLLRISVTGRLSQCLPRAAKVA